MYWQRLLKSQILHILLIDSLLLTEKVKKKKSCFGLFFNMIMYGGGGSIQFFLSECFYIHYKGL